MKLLNCWWIVVVISTLKPSKARYDTFWHVSNNIFDHLLIYQIRRLYMKLVLTHPSKLWKRFWPLARTCTSKHCMYTEITVFSNAHITRRSGDNVLHFAVRAKNFDLVEFLIEKGVDLTAEGEEGTPLSLANQLGDTHIVNMLKLYRKAKKSTYAPPRSPSPPMSPTRTSLMSSVMDRSTYVSNVIFPFLWVTALTGEILVLETNSLFTMLLRKISRIVSCFLFKTMNHCWMPAMKPSGHQLC